MCGGEKGAANWFLGWKKAATRILFYGSSFYNKRIENSLLGFFN
jgi:hypothetical protein